MITGVAIERSYPDVAHSVREARSTLDTSDAHHGTTTVRVTANGRARSFQIEGRTLRFYRRGDLKTNPKTCVGEVDDRSANWHEALKIWSALLERDVSGTSMSLAPLWPIRRRTETWSLVVVLMSVGAAVISATVGQDVASVACAMAVMAALIFQYQIVIQVTIVPLVACVAAITFSIVGPGDGRALAWVGAGLGCLHSLPRWGRQAPALVPLFLIFPLVAAVEVGLSYAVLFVGSATLELGAILISNKARHRTSLILLLPCIAIGVLLVAIHVEEFGPFVRSNSAVNEKDVWVFGCSIIVAFALCAFEFVRNTHETVGQLTIAFVMPLSALFLNGISEAIFGALVVMLLIRVSVSVVRENYWNHRRKNGHRLDGEALASTTAVRVRLRAPNLQ